MPYDDKDTPESTETGDEKLLTEIRENFRYFSEYWREAREERKIDMRYLAGDPWDKQDRDARKDAGRPCINHDELNQYVNSCVNNIRQNKKGVKIEPGGDGATDKSAEFRQNLIRAIEYKSMAPSIYANAFQAEVEGGYGFCRVSRRYVSDESDDQEIVIKPIQNPDSVLYSPDCKEPDWSDATEVFVLDPMPTAQFKERWPDAKVTDFTDEDRRIAPDWLTDKIVLVCEYWKVEEKKTGKKTPKGREIRKKTVMQYMTNGIEILERSAQPGTEIPIPAFIGMERWSDDGSGAKRKLSSLIRLARDPQMSLAYLNSLEMEEAGLTPKSPYTGYTGQFETDAEAWETVTKVPRAYIQVDPITDLSNGQVLPLPRRESFTPNFQAYEVAKDSCRRAIQAAMGSNSMPTSAQRDNAKSGIALEKIASEQAIGSYHFGDGYDRAVTRVGRIIESWIPVTYDTERDLAIRKPDDTGVMVRANTDEPYPDPKTGQPVHYPVEDGTHDVTISSGPSYESQREAVSEFLDTLISNLGTLPVTPPQAAKLLSLAIQMKQLGPKGDEMAEIISPSTPDQAAQQGQQIGQMQQQAQQSQLVIQQLQAELQKLQAEKAGRVVDNQFKMTLEQFKAEVDLAKAEIETKAQNLSERQKFLEDAWAQLHGNAHEGAMQASDQAHAQQQQGDAQAHQAQQAQAAQAAAQQAQQQPGAQQVQQ
jgi:hypothetical protein